MNAEWSWDGRRVLAAAVSLQSPRAAAAAEQGQAHGGLAVGLACAVLHRCGFR